MNSLIAQLPLRHQIYFSFNALDLKILLTLQIVAILVSRGLAHAVKERVMALSLG